jgi:plastocyanin
LGKTFLLKRGHVVRIEFQADRPGVYPVICGTHVPSMRAEIVVQPKG